MTAVQSTSWVGFLRSGERITGRRFRRQLAMAVSASVAITMLDVIGLALIVPLTGALTDSASDSGTVELGSFGHHSVGQLLAAILLFFVGKSLAATALRWWSTGVVTAAGARASTMLYNSYLRAPLEFFDTRHSAQQVRTLYQSANTLFTFGYLGVITLLSEGVAVLLLIIVVVVATPTTAVTAVAFFGLASLAYSRVIQPRIRRAGRGLEDSHAVALRVMSEGLRGLREYRVHGTEKFVADAFASERRQVQSVQRQIVFFSEIPRFYLEMIFAVGFVLLAGVTMRSGSGSSNLPDLALLATVCLRAVPSISRILAALGNIAVGSASLSTITADLEGMGMSALESEPGFDSRRPPCTGLAAPSLLEVRNATFHYDAAAAPTLENIDFVVRPGESLGVIGGSGAGKSTLLDLICGLRRPMAGSVLIDGRPVSPSDAHIGYVPQDVFILDDSIRANVAFGRPVTDDDVWQALEDAHIADFVRSLPGGLDELLGESGSRFSGGQRQRLGLARALCSHPSLLVLDEVTSALDTATESDVVRSLGELSGRITVVVVTHRISTVERCDNLLVLEAGRVTYVGPPEGAPTQ